MPDCKPPRGQDPPQPIRIHKGIFTQGRTDFSRSRPRLGEGTVRLPSKNGATPIARSRPSGGFCARKVDGVRTDAASDGRGASRVQPRRMQVRSGCGPGLLRRLLRAGAPDGNGIPSPHLPVRPRALRLGRRSRYPHVEDRRVAEGSLFQGGTKWISENAVTRNVAVRSMPETSAATTARIGQASLKSRF